MVATLLLVVALLAQVTAGNRLPLPGGPPQLVVLGVAVVAITCGPSGGAWAGFGAGLAADLLSAHTLGRLALVLTPIGYLIGLVPRGGVHGRGDRARTALLPAVAVGVAAGFAVLLDALFGAVLGAPVPPPGRIAAASAAATGYDLLLAIVALLAARLGAARGAPHPSPRRRAA
jgi:rod shape-determining protein MreD